MLNQSEEDTTALGLVVVTSHGEQPSLGGSLVEVVVHGVAGAATQHKRRLNKVGGKHAGVTAEQNVSQTEPRKRPRLAVLVGECDNKPEKQRTLPLDVVFLQLGNKWVLSLHCFCTSCNS